MPAHGRDAGEYRRAIATISFPMHCLPRCHARSWRGSSSTASASVKGAQFETQACGEFLPCAGDPEFFVMAKQGHFGVATRLANFQPSCLPVVIAVPDLIRERSDARGWQMLSHRSEHALA